MNPDINNPIYHSSPTPTIYNDSVEWESDDHKLCQIDFSYYKSGGTMYVKTIICDYPGLSMDQCQEAIRNEYRSVEFSECQTVKY